MGKSTSISLGDHFEAFINEQIMQGRYGSASEVIRMGLRLLEAQEQKRKALCQALIEGEESGESKRPFKDIVEEAKKEIHAE